MAPAVRDADTLRVLLSTDNHLGYCEKDPVRGEDSFRAFQEILRLAQAQHVDLLLLAGDLFHDNKPSRKTLYQTMRLLRTHCMGDAPVRFQIVSDQSINFPNFGTVNYEDPNYNVQLPVFSIHGNHDDPSREAGGSGDLTASLAALDLLSAANLVNYFGKNDKVDAIEVFPILMVKGATKVAIYGLGNQRDERLNRMFAQQKVVFRRPAESPHEWFSIFVVHQNRDDRGRGAKNCIPESFIPDFIDFVVWGHEHECLIDATESVKGDFFITQPGSSVATSLVEGEAKRKHVAVLEINGQSFRMTNHALKSVRPFKIGDIVLAEVEELDVNDPDVTDRITEVLERRVKELLREAKQEQAETGNTLDQVLIRLRVEHTGFPVLHNQRFGGRFVGKIANPNDILLFYRKKKERSSGTATGDNKRHVRDTLGLLDDPIRPVRLESVTIEDLLAKELQKPDQQLVFLPQAPLALALEDYIVKNIPTALDEFVTQVLEETQEELSKRKDTKSKQDIVTVVEKKKEKSDAEHLLEQEERAHGNQSNQRSRSNHDETKDEDDGGFQESLRSQSQSARHMMDTTMDISDEPASSRRASRFAKSSTPTRKRLRKAASSDEDEDDEFAPSTAAKRAAPAKRASRTPIKKQPAENEIDLCSSDSDKPARKRGRVTPQPKISDLFARQRSQAVIKDEVVDDVESDAEFTELTNVTATATTTAGGTNRYPSTTGISQSQVPLPSYMQSQTESQSQATAGVKKRKLPLSMLSSQSRIKKDEGAGAGSTVRRGWGRSRR
ncbi:TPA: hypothetical protein N0F65_009770 [Lagenidium giganteum]|uniref:Double-strand break repair protein n=1 Tax=Lagenidium giganteum TaxID=4803 RepID=A0AAV2YS46_9STRA|nr:TPA: hypothetical protein N0F65_009770 [Lagenidium giganteum]